VARRALYRTPTHGARPSARAHGWLAVRRQGSRSVASPRCQSLCGRSTLANSTGEAERQEPKDWPHGERTIERLKTYHVPVRPCSAHVTPNERRKRGLWSSR
jgi:hypothetical protein